MKKKSNLSSKKILDLDLLSTVNAGSAAAKPSNPRRTSLPEPVTPPPLYLDYKIGV